MVWRLLSYPINSINSDAGSGASQPSQLMGAKYQRRPPVDDSLMAIVVLVIVVWEFIQHLIAEKTRAERATQRDAGNEDRVLGSPSFRDMDCSFSQRTNEE